uniref:Cytochrome oxidase assembly protein putative n=1 Tax=Albugo laibachii Nc14 TaxID=890382 RepID=F0W1C8_9STRA|nr:cytochrome oxidase assembly protein putative [Albugo laibachii Nc14]|eukprot:CCA14856.1 cytochrome oxidase assembly protein putative [Albugo laibachii Nc14]
MTSKVMSDVRSSVESHQLEWWLYGSAATLAVSLTLAATAPFTRAGASMLYYKPRSIFRPKSDSQWQEEFNLYRDFSENNLNRTLAMEDFKRMYDGEYLHRVMGQLSTAVFVGPLAYLYAKGKIPSHLHGQVALIVSIGVAQWFLGRSNVKKSIEEEHGRRHERPTGRVPPFGLTEHTLFTMAKLGLVLWSALNVTFPMSQAVMFRESLSSSALKEIAPLRKYVLGATGLFAATASIGTMVAAIDAGKYYNTFPKMGKKWIPDEIFDLQPTIRNFFENPALVQLKHRILAVSSLVAYTAVYAKARKPSCWSQLPPETRMAFTAMIAVVGGQGVLGVTMLVNAVPTSLALVHQSGAALIFASSLWAIHSLRFARPMQLALRGNALKNMF